MRERPNRHAWKACVGQPTVGSNPTPSAPRPDGPGWSTIVRGLVIDLRHRSASAGDDLARLHALACDPRSWSRAVAIGIVIGTEAWVAVATAGVVASAALLAPRGANATTLRPRCVVRPGFEPCSSRRRRRRRERSRNVGAGYDRTGRRGARRARTSASGLRIAAPLQCAVTQGARLVDRVSRAPAGGDRHAEVRSARRGRAGGARRWLCRRPGDVGRRLLRSVGHQRPGRGRGVRLHRRRPAACLPPGAGRA